MSSWRKVVSAGNSLRASSPCPQFSTHMWHVFEPLALFALMPVLS